MPRVHPWFSTNGTVHHNNPNCNAGQEITGDDKRLGTGGRPLCEECKERNKKHIKQWDPGRGRG